MRSWTPQDIKKLLKNIRRFPHVWRWNHYLYRNIKIVKSCVCQLAKVHSTSEQDVLEVVDMLWKRFIVEMDIYLTYLSTKKQESQWEHFKDFSYIIDDIEHAILLRSALGDVLKNYPGLFADMKNKFDSYNNAAWNHIVERMSQYSGKKITQKQLSCLWYNFQDVKDKPLDYNIKFSVKSVPQWFHTSKTITSTSVRKLGLTDNYINLTDKLHKKDKPSKTNTKTTDGSRDVYEYKSSESEEEDFTDQMSSKLVDIERQHALLIIKEAVLNGGIVRNLDLKLSKHNVNDHDLDRAIFLSLIVKLSVFDRQHTLPTFYSCIWNQLVTEFSSVGLHYTEQQFIDRWNTILVRVKHRAINFRSASDGNCNKSNNLDWDVFFYFNKIVEQVQLCDCAETHSGVNDINKSHVQTNDVQETTDPVKSNKRLCFSKQNQTKRKQHHSIILMDDEELNCSSHLDVDKGDTNIIDDIPIKVESDSDDNIEFYNVEENNPLSVKTPNISNNLNIAMNNRKKNKSDSDCEIQNIENESNVYSNNIIESIEANYSEKNKNLPSNECSLDVSNIFHLDSNDDDDDDIPLSSFIKPNMTLEERNKLEELQKLKKMKGVFNYKPILTGEKQLPKNHWLNWWRGSIREDPTIKIIEKNPESMQSKRQYEKRKHFRMMKKLKRSNNDFDSNTAEQNSLHSSNDSTEKTDSNKSEEEVAANYLEKLLTESDISITPVST